MQLEISRQIFEKKNIQISNLIKFRPEVTEFFTRTGGQTDRHDKINGRFSQFYEKHL